MNASFLRLNGRTGTTGVFAAAQLLVRASLVGEALGMVERQIEDGWFFLLIKVLGSIVVSLASGIVVWELFEVIVQVFSDNLDHGS